ncbi:hypothetical protein ACFWIA_14575 [Streptomyces sp. NPDC127068]|uniref:hypothetical protein n=1 Tax=Streptomyces sp. NPDC127068 TaxID=3347127 RepID=UPI003658FFD1
MSEPFNSDVHHRACGICPSRFHPVGEFDVLLRPTPECPFNKADGHRYLSDGTPVCVHPDRVGLPAGRYKSENVPITVKLCLPADEAAVVPYLHDLLYGAAPSLLDDLIEQADMAIRRTFPNLDPVATLRRALN